MIGLSEMSERQSQRSPELPESKRPLLRVTGLRVEFDTPVGTLHAVNGLNLEVNAGERVVVLGESGSGKTVAAESIMGILPTPPGRIMAGEIEFQGRDLLRLKQHQRRRLRGPEMSMVFQDSLTAMNPAFTVGNQIAEMFRTHRGATRGEAKRMAVELLDRVQIPAARSRVDEYPHQFSGGMRQRAMIACAIALNPALLIADEPTTSLDVTVQAQIMTLLQTLTEETGMALLLITHDIGLAAEIGERITVMYAGRVMESGTTSDVLHRPANPYTRALMKAIPRIDRKGQDLLSIGGVLPQLTQLPAGCFFHPRCPEEIPECSSRAPELLEVEEGHTSACHLVTGTQHV